MTSQRLLKIRAVGFCVRIFNQSPLVTSDKAVGNYFHSSFCVMSCVLWAVTVALAIIAYNLPNENGVLKGEGLHNAHIAIATPDEKAQNWRSAARVLLPSRLQLVLHCAMRV